MTGYRVSEIFFSAQGEGNRVGTPSVFIRMAGCSLRCEYCDTRYSWEGGKVYSLKEMMSLVLSYIKRFPGVQQVVITGGEPLEQDIGEIIVLLRKKGIYISMETNGIHELPAEVDWLTVSPKDKSGFKINSNLFNKISEVKLIVNENLEVGNLREIRKISDRFPIFLQPQFFDRKGNEKAFGFYMDCIADGIPNVRLGFQLHKLYGID